MPKTFILTEALQGSSGSGGKASSILNEGFGSIPNFPNSYANMSLGDTLIH